MVGKDCMYVVVQNVINLKMEQEREWLETKTV